MPPSTADARDPRCRPRRPPPHDPHGAGARPGARDLRRRDDRAGRPVRRRRRRRLVLDQQPPDAARRRRGRARGRRLAAGQPGQGHASSPATRPPRTATRTASTASWSRRHIDTKNPRRIKVAITGPVGTLFARAVGINSWPAARTAKADYVLPVPMGSPQNYYGVGFYEGLVSHTSVATGHTLVRRAVVGPRVRREPRDRRAVGRPVDADQRHDPGLGELQQQRLRHREHERREAAAVDLRPAQRRVGDPHAGDGTGAHDQRHRGAPLGRVRVRELQQLDDRRPAVVGRRDDVVHGRRHAGNLGTSTSTATTCSAAARRPSDWGAHTWGRNDFSDANFRVRLTANKGCGTSSTTLNLDHARGCGSAGR